MTFSYKSLKNRRQHKRLFHALAIAITGCISVLILALVQPLHNINLWTSDQFYTSGSLSPNIIIAGIDDDTLETYGRWSEWPRSLHAEAVNNLSQAGARVIGFDVLFTDSSPDDESMAAAMLNAGNVVLAETGTGSIPAENMITYTNFLLPAELLEEASLNTGHANVIPDSDGKVRHLPLVVEDYAGQIHPSLTLAVLHSLFRMPLPEQYILTDGSLYLMARNVPVEEYYSLLINFSAGHVNRPYISYGDIIRGNFDPSLVKGKVVIIGMTATGELDVWPIPNMAAKVPGIYIHAAAMDTILQQNFLRPVGMGITVLLMLLLTFITALVWSRCGTWSWRDIVKVTGIVIGLSLCYIIAGTVMAGKGYIMNILYPLLLLLVLYIGNVIYMLITEQSDKQFVKGLFGRYVSPQISESIISLANCGKLDLGGEEREVTILFADMRNFTRISERLSPAEVVQMLNTYLGAVIDTTMENSGIINKFAGDNVMALWNAPYSQSRHALLAVKTALEAQEKLRKLQQDKPGDIIVQFGIGINTGKALAGNVGSAGRVEYTVIGDTVNLSSRICSVTPGGEVWIGPETYAQTKEYIESEIMEPQTFKGKTAPVTVYRVIKIKDNN